MRHQLRLNIALAVKFIAPARAMYCFTASLLRPLLSSIMRVRAARRAFLRSLAGHCLDPGQAVH